MTSIDEYSDRWAAETQVSVADIGEHAVLAQLRQVAHDMAPVASVFSDERAVGPGDDAAVLAVGGSTVITTDTVAEGRHFRRNWSTPEEVGARAAVAASADVAAMGAQLTAVVVAITVPFDTAASAVVGINRGAARAVARWGAAVVGGDVVAGSQIVLTVTALGDTGNQRAVRIGGSRSGDVVAVSGPVGSSAAGLAVLSHGDGYSDYPNLTAAYRVPIVDLAAGGVANTYHAHAMTDISDGLVSELHTMAQAAQVGIDISAAAIPRTCDISRAAAYLNVDMVDWLLHGGEDHQLVATFPTAAPPGWTVIGSVRGDPGVPVRVDGVSIAPRGWQSFQN